MKRNSIEHEGFVINPVTDFSIFMGFFCCRPTDRDRDLDDFLLNDAERHFIDKIAVTYSLAHISNPEQALAFATLTNDAIVPDVANIDYNFNIPEVAQYSYYKYYPAVRLGRFGVSLDSQREGYGTLFITMLKKLLNKHNRTGCRFITVDARRDKKDNIDTTSFYEKNGFSFLACRGKTSRSVSMYFDLAKENL